MKKVLSDLRYKGQPVYEEWTEDRKALVWSSREVEGTPTNWKIKREIELLRLPVDHRRSMAKQMASIAAARNQVKALCHETH